MYILAAAQLTKIRDEQHWKALRHPTIEDYAQKRLGLGRTTLYHYLQVHAWLKRDHPAWLARKPQGFIPSLTGASARDYPSAFELLGGSHHRIRQLPAVSDPSFPA